MAENKDITVNIEIHGTLDPDVIAEEVKYHLRKEIGRIEYREEIEKWAKIGRKPNEFKVGDIVRITQYQCGAEKGKFVEVNEVLPEGSISYGYVADTHAIELIVPVETRFDR